LPLERGRKRTKGEETGANLPEVDSDNANDGIQGSMKRTFRKTKCNIFDEKHFHLKVVKNIPFKVKIISFEIKVSIPFNR